jgi:hypothetical protein
MSVAGDNFCSSVEALVKVFSEDMFRSAREVIALFRMGSDYLRLVIGIPLRNLDSHFMLVGWGGVSSFLSVLSTILTMCG